MARLQITKETLRIVSILSKNKCAFAGCDQPILNSAGVYIAELCHIEAAMPGGPRYNLNQSDEERRSAENLMYLCHRHHVETDDAVRYPVSALRAMKAAHELLPEVVFNVELLLARVVEVLQQQDELSELVRSALSPRQSLSPNYAIRGPIGDNAWLPQQGRFYTFSFPNGSAMKFMMKDGWMHVQQTLPDGSVQYFEVNEAGGVRQAQLPHPLHEYTVDVPTDLILRIEPAKTDVGEVATNTILKWSRGNVVRHFHQGMLVGLDMNARCTISHGDKRITVLG